MADMPLACNIEGDYGYKVIVVDDSDTMAEVIQKATDQIVGVFVKPFPLDAKLEARIPGEECALPDTTTVKQAQLMQMAAIEISQIKE